MNLVRPVFGVHGSDRAAFLEGRGHVITCHTCGKALVLYEDVTSHSCLQDSLRVW